MFLIADLFERGGIFMLILLVGAMVGTVLGTFRLRRATTARFTGLGAGIFLGLIATGLTGSFQGLTLTFEAVASANLATKEELMRSGIDIAMTTTWASLVFAITLIPLHGVSAHRERKLPPAIPRMLPLGLGVGLSLLVLAQIGALFVFHTAMNGFFESMWAQSNGDAEAVAAYTVLVHHIETTLGTGMGIGLVSIVLSLVMGTIGLVTGIKGSKNATEKQE